MSCTSDVALMPLRISQKNSDLTYNLQTPLEELIERVHKNNEEIAIPDLCDPSESGVGSHTSSNEYNRHTIVSQPKIQGVYKTADCENDTFYYGNIDPRYNVLDRLLAVQKELNIDDPIEVPSELRVLFMKMSMKKTNKIQESYLDRCERSYWILTYMDLIGDLYAKITAYQGINSNKQYI